MIIALIRYTDSLQESFGGMAYGTVILIRPKYRDDNGLHAHVELLGFVRIADKYKLAISTDRALLALTSEAQM